jgi:hypothetical protein
MKICVLLVAVLVVGGFAANSNGQQTHQTRHDTAKPVAKRAPVSSLGSSGSRPGSIGGPVNKGPKINGTGMRPKH